MSLFFLFTLKSIIESGTLDEYYLICWALFSVADALWVRTIFRRE